MRRPPVVVGKNNSDFWFASMDSRPISKLGTMPNGENFLFKGTNSYLRYALHDKRQILDCNNYLIYSVTRRDPFRNNPRDLDSSFWDCFRR